MRSGRPRCFGVAARTNNAAWEVVADPGKAIDVQASSAVVDQIAKVLAAQGPAPLVPLQPGKIPPIDVPGSPRQGPPAPPPAPAPQAAQAPQAKSIGEVLMASPDALQAVAGLLGIGSQEGTRQVAAPIPGGTVGRVLPGLELPTTQGIGQLLAQIPRLG